MQWWSLVQEWEDAKRAAWINKEQKSPTIKIKKEEPLTPKIPINIKVEELPTPMLQYTTEHSRYTSLNPNIFDWGDTAMVK